MPLVIVIVLVGLPLLEISVFIEVGKRIGVGATILLCILAAFAGSMLLRHQGLTTLRRAQESLQQQVFPAAELFDGLCILLAGALLVLPGFISDAVGAALFLPPVRRALRRVAARKLEQGGVSPGPATGAKIIEVDYEDVTPPDSSRPGAGQDRNDPHKT